MRAEPDEEAPLPLPDDDAPRRSRPKRPREEAPHYPEGPPGLWLALKYLSFAIGLLLVLGAFSASTPQAAALAGIACFFGIGARLAQAEQHRLPPK
jgi:hypothetical protein